MMPRPDTLIKMIDEFNFTGYAAVWKIPDPAGLVFTKLTDIGTPAKMIGMTIAHRYWVRESEASHPFMTSSDVGLVTHALRTRWGLFIHGRFTSRLGADPRLLKLLRQQPLALTPDTLKSFAAPTGILTDFPIVRFSLYVPTGIAAQTQPTADHNTVHPGDPA